MLNFKLIQRRANRSAAGYESHHYVQQAMAERMLQRLQYIKLQPQAILDVGCATGWLAPALQQRYPEAALYGVDFAVQRLNAADAALPAELVAADMHALPLQDSSVDLIIANDSLAWVAELSMVLQDLLRVLRPGGLLMLTSFGPHSLSRVRELCQQQRCRFQPAALMDMHDLGDALLHAGWADPVMDSEWLQLHYDSTAQLVRDLRGLGAGATDYRGGLMTPHQWQQLWSSYPVTDDGQLLVDVELVHGHAWKPLQATAGAQLNEAGEVVVPLSSLKRQ